MPLAPPPLSEQYVSLRLLVDPINKHAGEEGYAIVIARTRMKDDVEATAALMNSLLLVQNPAVIRPKDRPLEARDRGNQRHQQEHENSTQRDLSQFEHVLAKTKQRQETMKPTATRGRERDRGRARKEERRKTGRGREREGDRQDATPLRCTSKQVSLQHFICDCMFRTL
jgi:hypothetical protein